MSLLRLLFVGVDQPVVGDAGDEDTENPVRVDDPADPQDRHRQQQGEHQLRAVFEVVVAGRRPQCPSRGCAEHGSQEDADQHLPQQVADRRSELLTRSDPGQREDHHGQCQTVVGAALDGQQPAEPARQRPLGRRSGHHRRRQNGVGGTEAGADDRRQRDRNTDDERDGARGRRRQRHRHQQQNRGGPQQRAEGPRRVPECGGHHRPGQQQSAPLQQDEVAGAGLGIQQICHVRAEQHAEQQRDQGLTDRQPPQRAAEQRQHQPGDPDRRQQDVQLLHCASRPRSGNTSALCSTDPRSPVAHRGDVPRALTAPPERQRNRRRARHTDRGDGARHRRGVWVIGSGAAPPVRGSRPAPRWSGTYGTALAAGRCRIPG